VGTLDDAIREHLELKRKQGLSEEELERKEAEALGRRSSAPEPTPADPPTAAQEPSPPEPVAEAEFLDEPDVPAVDPEVARNGSSATAADAPSPEPPAPEPAPDNADLFDQDLIDRGTSTPEEPAEDFLEETPDFLEETPEHDRLWFEQKPPKDFDFD
jgi:hypothetical protein